MANREYICMEETPAETQKLIRTWVSTGYSIDIVFQGFQPNNPTSVTKIVTSLWRTK